MKKLLVLIITLLIAQGVMAERRYIRPYPEQYCSFANQERSMARLENKILGQSYDYDTAENRIARMEERLFGASQSGDLQKRLEMVRKANRNSFQPYNYNNNYSDNYYTPPIVAGSGWKSILHSFGNSMLGGVPTGITPQMDPAYMDYFETERNAMKFNDSGEYRDVKTNHGWYNYSKKRGTSTGVTLLD